MASFTAFQPDWLSPPGETLSDALEEQGLTQSNLAERTGFSKKHVNDLISGRATISVDAAIKLEATVGGPARFWLAREAQYREALARRDRLERLKANADWLKTLPLNEMLTLNWVQQFSHLGAQVEECLRFFGVASVDAWQKIWQKPLAAFRGSSKSPKKAGVIAAWLREGERRASAQRCGAFDKSRFRDALGELRSLTLTPDPESFIPEMVRKCAQFGVSVVLIPTPKGCPVSGATKWLTPDKGMLVLSLRYKTHDHMWFSFFHECGHLLLHGKRMLFFEETGPCPDKEEQEADRFAADLLIPREFVSKLQALGSSKDAVRRFADELGIAPGIVVGRMQRERLLPWTHLNDLKIRYQ